MSRTAAKMEVARPEPVLRYRIPAGEARGELLVKHSTFIGTVGRACSPEVARSFVERARVAYPKANHHAWAFKITDGPRAIIRSSDDGEPGGTAGRPMLAVLEASGLREVVAVGTRYFGGIKLGPGGLVRAYSSVVRQALSRLATVECALHHVARVTVRYALYGKMQSLLSRYGIVVEETTFAEQVTMLLAVPYEQAAQVTHLLRDMTSGEVGLEESWLEDRYYVREG